MFKLGVFPLLILLALPGRGAAQVALPPLSFLGLEAGARLDKVDRWLRVLGAPGLRCDRSHRDVRVQECRAPLTDPVTAQPLALWLSAIDSTAGIMTVSGTVTGADLDRWARALERRFGVVDAQVQGGQWMLQWVRQGRMLRLTWKVEQGSRIASVSLVDGGVLDAWGRGRTRGESAEPLPAQGAVSP